MTRSLKYAKQFLKEKKANLMIWPAQSPDLYPIEHLWKDVKEAVARHRPKNQQHLWEIIEAESKSIPISHCRKLIESMTRRCSAVLNNKGQAIKF